MLATNAFLGGTFLTYGTDVHMYYHTPPEENHRLGWHNPMCEAFPRVLLPLLRDTSPNFLRLLAVPTSNMEGEGISLDLMPFASSP